MFHIIKTRTLYLINTLRPTLSASLAWLLRNIEPKIKSKRFKLQRNGSLLSLTKKFCQWSLVTAGWKFCRRQKSSTEIASNFIPISNASLHHFSLLTSFRRRLFRDCPVRSTSSFLSWIWFFRLILCYFVWLVSK